MAPCRRCRWLLGLALGALAGATPPVAADEAGCGAADVGRGVIAAAAAPVGSGRPWLRLAAPVGTATGVGLAGIIVPRGLGVDDRRCFDRLAAAHVGTALRLMADKIELDRRRRLVALVGLPDGRLLQQELLEAGLAVSDGTLAACASTFSASESLARRGKRGIWATPTRLIVDDGTETPSLPDFLVLRGRIVSVGRSGRTTYLNFGRDRRTDMTVRLDDRIAADLAASGRRADGLVGVVVEARGWVEDRDGPLLQLPAASALALWDDGRW